MLRLLRHNLGLILRSTTKPRVYFYAVGRPVSTLPASPTLKPISLRPYQESCLQSCLDALRAPGTNRIGVSLPTGSGKTTVFVTFISMLSSPPSHPDANRALIIVNSIELARQTVAQVNVLFPNLKVEMDQGSVYKASGQADVTIATYQSLIRGDRIKKFDPDKLKCVIVDEAHHAAAPSYRKILSHFDANILNPDVDVPPPNISRPIPILGFSATFSRHDGLALSSVFQRIVYHRDFLDMIKEQWLCNVRFTSVQAKLNLNQVTINTKSGEFNPTSLSHVINTDSVNNLVVQSWLDRVSTRRSTLVFCVNLAHLRDLTAAFRRAGVDARYVYAATPAAERKALVESFRAGEFPVLLNVSIFTEGTDIPNIDCVVVAKPTRSRNVFAQMIGRGMRLSPQTGKDDCHVIDFVDSTNRVAGIVSVPTLFGLDPNVIIADESVESLERRAATISENGLDANAIPEPTSVTYVDYENPFDLVQDASGAPHVAQISRHAWVGCGDGIYVLECMGKGYIRIETDTDKGDEQYYDSYFVEVLPEWQQGSTPFKRSRYRKPRKILKTTSLDDAIRASDKYAISKVLHGERLVVGLLRSAKWRKMPATKSQKEFLSKRLKATKQEGMHFDLDNISKGQAANMITRLKHGAQARFAKKIRCTLKEVNKAEKERQRRARELVSVGPLHANEPDIADV